MNIKFQKYKDVFSQPERIRLKRKTNESDENINVRKISQNFKSKIIADIKNNTSQENITKNKTISGQQQNNKTILRNAVNDSGDYITYFVEKYLLIQFNQLFFMTHIILCVCEAHVTMISSESFHSLSQK